MKCSTFLLTSAGFGWQSLEPIDFDQRARKSSIRISWRPGPLPSLRRKNKVAAGYWLALTPTSAIPSSSAFAIFHGNQEKEIQLQTRLQRQPSPQRGVSVKVPTSRKRREKWGTQLRSEPSHLLDPRQPLKASRPLYPPVDRERQRRQRARSLRSQRKPERSGPSDPRLEISRQAAMHRDLPLHAAQPQNGGRSRKSLQAGQGGRRSLFRTGPGGVLLRLGLCAR